MAESHHYFHMPTDEYHNRHIDLISRDEPDTENCIQMIVHGAVYGTSQKGDIGIWLSEDAQNDLIVGLLERRGVPAEITRLKIAETIGQWQSNGKTVDPISSTSTQQSTIHPVKNNNT